MNPLGPVSYPEEVGRKSLLIELGQSMKCITYDQRLGIGQRYSKVLHSLRCEPPQKIMENLERKW